MGRLCKTAENLYQIKNFVYNISLGLEGYYICIMLSESCFQRYVTDTWYLRLTLKDLLYETCYMKVGIYYLPYQLALKPAL